MQAAIDLEVELNKLRKEGERLRQQLQFLMADKEERLRIITSNPVLIKRLGKKEMLNRIKQLLKHDPETAN